MELVSKYGIPKDAGGDSPENIAKMEKCVMGVQKSGKDKESAIRICKSSMFSQSMTERSAARLELAAVAKILSQKNLNVIQQCISILEDIAGVMEPPDEMQMAAQNRTLSQKNIDAIGQVIDALEKLIGEKEPNEAPNTEPQLEGAFLRLEGETLMIETEQFVGLDAEGNLSFTAGERLGQAILRAREDKFLTREALSEKMTIGPEVICQIECGMVNNVPDDILQSFADILGLDVQNLEELQVLDQEQPIGMGMGGPMISRY